MKLSLLLFPALLAAQPYDIVIRGGRVIDPESRLDAVRNVGIKGKSVAVITPRAIKGKREIDASGQVVTAGFIDLHSHGQTPENYRLKALDGVTAALELEIGVSPVDAWYREREGKALVHFGASAGHVPARMVIMKDTGSWLPRDNAITKVATAAEQSGIRDLLNQGLTEGALGLGFGFGYTPKAGNEELEALFQLAADRKAVSFVHMRFGSNGEPGLAASLHEVIAYAVTTGASIHVVHIGASSTTKFDMAMRILAAAKKRGFDFTFESYPYIAGMTRLETSIFDPGFQERLGLQYKDMLWVETGERLTAETFARYRKQGGLVATFTNTEEMIRKNMAHPGVIIASDGIMENGKGHPRAAGTYARVLGRYVRQEKAVSLIDALAKMSLLPARRLETMAPAMRRKGRIKAGADADIVVFDPAKVIDHATYEKPNLPSEGFSYVLVDGTPVVDSGKVVDGVLPGRGLRTTSK